MAAQALHLFGLSQALLDFHLLVRAANALAANPNPITTARNRNEIHLAHVDWQVGVLVLFGLKELQSWNLLE